MKLHNLRKHMELVLLLIALVSLWYLAPKSPIFRAQVSGEITAFEQRNELTYPIVQFVSKNGEAISFTEKNSQTIAYLNEAGLRIGDKVPVVYPLYDVGGSYVGIVGRGWILVEIFYHAVLVTVIGGVFFILLLRLVRKYL